MTTRYPGAGSTAIRRFAPSIPSVSLPSEARTVSRRFLSKSTCRILPVVERMKIHPSGKRPGPVPAPNW
jgi:hypothetical protein